MARPRLPGRPIVVWILAVFVAFLLEVSEASAQTAVKRGAGTASRGDTNRRAGGLAGQTRGRQVALPSERKSSKSKSSFDSKLGKKDDKKSAYSSTYGSSSSDDEEEEEAGYGERTLGKACMYGARGEVIFRPAGAVCRGDVVPPLPTAPDPSAGAPTAKPAPRRPKQLGAGAPQRPRKAVRPMANRPTHRPPPKPRAQARRPQRPASGGISEDCIIAPDGRVLYTPAGMTCPR